MTNTTDPTRSDFAPTRAEAGRLLELILEDVEKINRALNEVASEMQLCAEYDDEVRDFNRNHANNEVFLRPRDPEFWATTTPKYRIAFTVEGRDPEAIRGSIRNGQAVGLRGVDPDSVLVEEVAAVPTMRDPWPYRRNVIGLRDSEVWAARTASYTRAVITVLREKVNRRGQPRLLSRVQDRLRGQLHYDWFAPARFIVTVPVTLEFEGDTPGEDAAQTLVNAMLYRAHDGMIRDPRINNGPTYINARWGFSADGGGGYSVKRAER